ncbi:MAG: HK97 gp10 family phage protein [Psychrobacter sp.]|nr:HK97 gp10 family phage protein [Psychrobacter sp.]
MATEIEGLDEVLAKFQQLGDPRKSKNAATRSARKAMNIVKKDAIANAKALDDAASPERIWKNITVKASRSKDKGVIVMKVGVKGGARQYVNTKRNRREGRAGQTYQTAGDKSNPGGDTWYWRMVELGTAHSAAAPFLRPALYNNLSNVQSTFTDAFSIELDKEIDKL